MDMIVAVPSELPGGLDAPVSEHFGQCAAFTMVAGQGDKAPEVTVLPAPDHAEGGCMAVVRLLAEHGVQAVVVSGIGARPLAGLMQAGIEVYRGEPRRTVRAAVEGLEGGRLPRFEAEFACGSGHAGHH